jgi:hypothetical protein
MLGKCLLPPPVEHYTGLLPIIEPETSDNIAGCMSTHCEQLSRLFTYLFHKMIKGCRTSGCLIQSWNLLQAIPPMERWNFRTIYGD